MEQKGYVMKRSRVDIGPLLRELEKEYQLKAKVEGFPFTAIYPNEVVVRADQPNFKNALVNLIENAIKYGGDGQVILKVVEHPKEYHFRVEDQGPGIPKAHQQDIFKKFYRIMHDQPTYKKGYGLGLHYVKQVVKFHKGKILLESSPGQGTAFVLILPKA
jgi:two-component system phosphate regulon sensor histidine kinase PhoR